MNATPVNYNNLTDKKIVDFPFEWSIPSSVIGNLRQSFSIRPYQKEAFARFDTVWRNRGSIHSSEDADNTGKVSQSTSSHYLFHMATGSGKTLVMAGLILYLYEKGYRNFLFFVNSTNIIDKTKDNFLNSISSKYLFADRIVIGGKVVNIKAVDNFQGKNEDDINVIFSTIQGLHASLNTPKENSVTFEDFESEKTVLISDESHHINAETKRRNELKGDEKNNILTWENTVESIFQSNIDNVLLEFTATIDLSIPSISEKYKDKLIYDYPLSRFRQDGYSKEVMVIQTDLSLFDRAIVSLLMSQYRKEIFHLYGQSIKPVILFKSKTIKDSIDFYNLFVEGLRSLTPKNLLDVLSKIEMTNRDILIRQFGQTEEELRDLIENLQNDFGVSKLLIVNSKEESEGKQLMVNSLEEASNPYRAIFAVDKLNEGWDVLNLFDIVRLHDELESSKSKNKKTTISEAQLIGRGARYCPFQLASSDALYQRKYDDVIDHPLRVCEQLYYHSPYNPSYIQDLDLALEAIGIKEKKGIIRKTEAYHQPKAEKYIIDNSSEEFSFIKLVQSLNLTIDLSEMNKSSILKTNELGHNVDNFIIDVIRFVDFDTHVVRKAINTLPFYEFFNLRKFLPGLGSIKEFMSSSDYLGGLVVNVVGSFQGQNQISLSSKLYIVTNLLAKVEELMRERVCIKIT